MTTPTSPSVVCLRKQKDQRVRFTASRTRLRKLVGCLESHEDVGARARTPGALRCLRFPPAFTRPSQIQFWNVGTWDGQHEAHFARRSGARQRRHVTGASRCDTVETCPTMQTDLRAYSRSILPRRRRSEG